MRTLVPAERGAHRALRAGDAVAAALGVNHALTERDVELGLLEDFLRVVLDHVAFFGGSGTSLRLVGGAFLARHATLFGALLLPVEKALELVLLAVDAALRELLDLLVVVEFLGVGEASLFGFLEHRFEVLVQLGSLLLLATALVDVGPLGLELKTVLLLDASALGFGSAQFLEATADDVLDLDPLGTVGFDDSGLALVLLVLLVAPGVVGGQLLLLVAPGGVGVDCVEVHVHFDSWKGVCLGISISSSILS